MDIAEIIKESEMLKAKHIETAQKLAEAKHLLLKIKHLCPYLSAELPNNALIIALEKDINEVLQ